MYASLRSESARTLCTVLKSPIAAEGQCKLPPGSARGAAACPESVTPGVEFCGNRNRQFGTPLTSVYILWPCRPRHSTRRLAMRSRHSSYWLTAVPRQHFTATDASVSHLRGFAENRTDDLTGPLLYYLYLGVLAREA